MARYVLLLNWTDQGVRTFKETLDRAQSAGQMAEQMGGSMEQIYWTLGPHDIVAMTQFDDDEAATAFALAVSSLGNVRTTTMRAFDREEIRDVISRAG